MPGEIRVDVVKATTGLGTVSVNNEGIRVSGVVTATSFDGALLNIRCAIVQDQKADGTAGGTFTSGAWQIRDLNTEVFDPDGIVTLSSNQFTLIPGTYIIDWTAPANICAIHQSRLYNVTDAVVVAYGVIGHCHVSNVGTNPSVGYAAVVIASNTTYRIEHRCETTRLTDGFGYATPWTGNIETYTTVKITKIG
jgi:hypothetical protein